MEIIRDITAMQQFAASLPSEGRRLGLVPTMGSLHQGHLSLIRLLEGRCDLKAASIFVNPIQFGRGEDFERYPRNEARDFALLTEAGCELVFCPQPEDMYAQGFQTHIEVEGLSQPLCGAFRPGHFRGVATVVLKLFTITRCAVAAFGLKDYQQAMVIKQMVSDLNLSVDLVFGETLREPDGLAMSSRNAYLSQEERRIAVAVPRSLEWARRELDGGECNPESLKQGMGKILTSSGQVRVQYVEVADPDTLLPLERIAGRALLVLAVYVGKSRLIDNTVAGPGSGAKPIAGVSV